jgi:hypothetical protein
LVAEIKTAAGAVPRCVLLFSRVDFAWLNPVIMRIMRQRYNTRFVLAIPDKSWRERCSKWLGPQDRIIDLMELAKQARSRPIDPENELKVARQNEVRHGVVYMRDIMQGDRSISAYYLRYAPNSPWTSIEPPSFANLLSEINFYFDFFSKLFVDEQIDMVLERPGGIMVNACIHAAMSHGIPVSFSLPSRYKSYVMWSYDRISITLCSARNTRVLGTSSRFPSSNFSRQTILRATFRTSPIGAPPVACWEAWLRPFAITSSGPCEADGSGGNVRSGCGPRFATASRSGAHFG